jgi:hypothetical protein
MVRSLMDELRQMPVITQAELDKQRAVGPGLGISDFSDILQTIGKPGTWFDKRYAWHLHWKPDGYIAVISIFSDSNDIFSQQVLVNTNGGVFLWRIEGRSFPNVWYSQIAEDQMQNFKQFLSGLPQSDPKSGKNRCIISFMKEGRWVTNVYDVVPKSDVLEEVLKKIGYFHE